MRYEIVVKYECNTQERFIDANNLFDALWLGYIRYKKDFDMYERSTDMNSSVIVVFSLKNINEKLEGKLIDLYEKAQKILEESK